MEPRRGDGLVGPRASSVADRVLGVPILLGIRDSLLRFLGSNGDGSRAGSLSTELQLDRLVKRLSIVLDQS